MPYEKTNWKDRAVQFPRRIRLHPNADGSYDYEPNPGEIVEPGTPVNAQNMAHIEDGIAAAETSIAQVKADLNTKQPALTSATATLLGGAANWPGNRQTVAVPGVKAGPGTRGIPSCAPDQLEMWGEAGIVLLDSDVDGQATFACKEAPQQDIEVRLLLLEVVT